MTSMIYRILECREDDTKQLTEYGDGVRSDDGEDEWSFLGQGNPGTPL